LKHILQLPINTSDLKDIVSINEYNSLEFIKTCAKIDQFLINFTWEGLDIIPNGNQIIIDDNSKLDYIKSVANWKMTIEIRDQIDAFLRGFYEIIP
jgi:E3 ubiquitin-protein ligase HUWE1